MFAVTILGNNSAVPAFDRHPTSQVVSYEGNNFLVDCGEGTQIQLIRYKIRRSRISHIFISHLHGDHYFGLPGLLNTFSLLSRRQELHVFGPAPLQEIVALQLRVADNEPCYPLHFHSITGASTLLETENLSVRCFPTQHRIECYGFRFDEKKQPRKLDPVKAREAGIPVSFFEKLKDGQDYRTTDGLLIKNEEVTLPAEAPRSYVFSADTRYDESLIPFLKEADTLYHETTYLDNLREKAEARFHSTSMQAAEMALKSGAKKLLIGHFSSKYDSLDDFEKEARNIFPNTEIAQEGACYEV